MQEPECENTPSTTHDTPEKTVTRSEVHVSSEQRTCPVAAVSRLRRLKDQLTANEVSGSLGDLGLYLSLTIAVAKMHLVQMNIVLFYGGFLMLVTGLVWDVPMPIQPMKSIVSAALAGHLAAKEVMTAGIITSALVLFLSVTRLINVIDRMIPKAVTHGVQMGLGVSLAMNGVALVNALPWLSFNGVLNTGILGTVTFVSFYFTECPSALILVLVGFVYAAAIATYPPYQFVVPFDLGPIQNTSATDWYHGFLFGALPQIPVTILNSVVGVCHLNADLFPDKTVTATSISFSVGLMNLFLCPFGSFPSCHGAGGLAGQYKFGARSGTIGPPAAPL